MEISLIGHGAIATYVAKQLDSVEGAALTHVIVRPGPKQQPYRRSELRQPSL